jgi:hypothetical protein
MPSFQRLNVNYRGIDAGDDRHLMTCRNQLLHNRFANVACGVGDNLISDVEFGLVKKSDGNNTNQPANI